MGWIALLAVGLAIWGLLALVLGLTLGRAIARHRDSDLGAVEPPLLDAGGETERVGARRFRRPHART